MNDLKMDRRRFLRGSGGLLLGTLLFTSGPVALLAPSHAWALPLTHLDSDAGKRLLLMMRRLYPHDSMEDAVYALSVKALDDAIGQDPAKGQTVRAGLQALDKAAGGHWLKLDEAGQVAALERIQHSDFFALVRGTTVNALYSNELAYTHFGYEGASFPKGGYLHRGFNDLTWLPAPSSDASPAPFA
ncbi:MAG: hypothetical protein GAK45_00274 [Pseudomonas citronellolis]|nr:MAG: hypothetical protein GAK45_00274 [Pseudomonas citronellolis]